MPPVGRRSSFWPLLGISVVLFLVPTSLSRKARLATVALFIPIQGVATTTGALPTRVLPSKDQTELRAKNSFLDAQVQKQQNEIELLRIKLEQVSRLKQALPENSFRILHAAVLLPTDASPWRKSLTLSAGTRVGVQKGMLVLYNNQLVGRILEVGPWTSLVQLVTDPAFRAGAVAVPRTTMAGVAFDRRQVGVYEGTSGQSGALKWFLSGASIDPEGFVVTTEDPLNGVPRGLLLGHVASAPRTQGRSPTIDVEPVIDFRALEEVMILVEPHP
jgi:rod shape-determining protein MreC